MQEFRISKNEAGLRLDKYLAKLLNKAPQSVIQKNLRKKNILLNDAKADGSVKTNVGDRVQIYMRDETIALFRDHSPNTAREETGSRSSGDTKVVSDLMKAVQILYEDENILVLNKPAGILSQKAKPTDVSVVDFVLQHYAKKPHSQDETFTPGICNRLDRNTDGLMLAGLSLIGLQELNRIIKDRSLQKYYLCVVKGKLPKPGHLRGYLSKDPVQNKVSVSKQNSDTNSAAIETEYEPLAYNDSYSVLKVHLITGKTHQIRAHLASIGHPLIGDRKYDSEADKKQARVLLHSWEMHFPKMTGELEYLSGQCFTAPVPQDIADFIKKENLKIKERKDGNLVQSRP